MIDYSQMKLFYYEASKLRRGKEKKMKEFKSFAKRAATIFLAIAIICTSSGFDQLTTIAAETSEQPRLTTEVAPAEAAPAAVAFEAISSARSSGDL